MNLQRITELYDRRGEISPTDADNLQRMISDYPFYGKPFAILARHYFETGHYRFSDMLRQAAMRVSDRKALYYYIHGGKDSGSALQERFDQSTNEISDLSGQEKEHKPGISDFLQDEDENDFEVNTIIEADQTVSQADSPEIDRSELLIQKMPESSDSDVEMEKLQDHQEDRRPVEFEFESHFREHADNEQIPLPETKDIIAEEIETEFSFSGTLHNQEENPAPETSSQVVVSESSESQPENDGSGLQTAGKELRKHPPYNIADFLEKNPDKLSETESPVEEKQTDSGDQRDFLYWLSHPQTEEDKKPASTDLPEGSRKQVNDKTDLIERFITLNPQISRPKKEFYNPENMAKRSELPDLDFVTETLAGIYYEQGNLDLALKAYEKLSLQNPSKQVYFADLIKKIKQERK